MTDTWSALLDAAGARRDASGIPDFNQNDQQAAQDTQLFALDDLGCLLVHGPDAGKFLQGQVTCDMNQLSRETARRGAHCNTKGRMVFSFLALELTAEEPCIGLVMPRQLIPGAQQILAKYIVFSKAKLRVEEDYRLLGLQGGDSGDIVRQWLGDLPPTKDAVHQKETAACIRIDDNRFLCLLPTDQAEQRWQDWTPRCRLEGYRAWQLADIRQGLGGVLPGTEDEFIPQMVNLQIVGGVSFTKGCYIGQEVVARMQYLGKLKRHMRRLKVDGEQTVAPGQPLYTAAGGQSVGKVVVAASNGEGAVEMLALTTDESFEKDDLYLDVEKKEKLQRLDLPYALA